MARANRHHIPGQVWHITHRCHKKEFFLKFARDRKRWLQWLFEAKKRYGLDILNYTVTSNGSITRLSRRRRWTFAGATATVRMTASKTGRKHAEQYVLGLLAHSAIP